MPSLFTSRRISSVLNNNAQTLGEIRKEQSDWAMEELWDSDIQSKKCFIYDYYHDDFIIKYDTDGVTPLYSYTLKEGMAYENTRKTPIDAKFIIKSHQSIDKDQVEYYLQFKPSQPTVFSKNDNLYYFETDYRQKYGNDDFIGLYVDIPDEKNIYHKWLICSKEISNQFTKYLILPCNFYLRWVEKDKNSKYKRSMWASLRDQKSYTIGVYSDRYFTRPDNQQKIWLPMNPISEKIWYNDDDEKTMRLVISVPTENPIVWAVTKVENIRPIGLQKLTIYQKSWNSHTDYIEKDSDGNIIGMWADYFDTQIQPTDKEAQENNVVSSVRAKITASTTSIKVGGSYKTLTVNVYDSDNILSTSEYESAIINWKCSIDNIDWTDKVTWRNTSFNQIKIKFPNDKTQLGKILNITCHITKGTEIINSESTQFSLSE